MSDKPILFSAPMVQALLAGRKTQTRRVLKPQPPQDLPYVGIYAPKLTAVFGGDCVEEEDIKIPLGYMPGDRLWVREAWRASKDYDAYPPREMSRWPVHYEADGRPNPRDELGMNGRYRHARFMPRWASRLTLTVTQVRVQRLQDISKDDAITEGFAAHLMRYPEGDHIGRLARAWFANTWGNLYGPDAWDANPWVCALTFDVHHVNIDAMDAPCA